MVNFIIQLIFPLIIKNLGMRMENDATLDFAGSGVYFINSLGKLNEDIIGIAPIILISLDSL